MAFPIRVSAVGKCRGPSAPPCDRNHFLHSGATIRSIKNIQHEVRGPVCVMIDGQAGSGEVEMDERSSRGCGWSSACSTELTIFRLVYSLKPSLDFQKLPNESASYPFHSFFPCSHNTSLPRSGRDSTRLASSYHPQDTLNTLNI